MDDDGHLPTGFARSELILGGQKSGKSRHAEMIAARWLAVSPTHRAVLIATARAGDDEMRSRIARHKLDRANNLPEMKTFEEPIALASAIASHAEAGTLIVVDCITLWLANLFASPGSKTPSQPSEAAIFESNTAAAQANRARPAIEFIADKIGQNTFSPIVFVSNEIGLGVVPMGALSRDFVDTLGIANQRLAAVCERVTFMAAGLPLHLKGGA
jgi:adenosylcobinamide kinase / adenosylcobinamide-phosphate guanylyltransferase